jgi:hypothetical protein
LQHYYFKVNFFQDPLNMILEGDFRGTAADSLKPSKYAFASASYGEPQCLNNLQTISTTFPPESRATTPILATLGLGQKPTSEARICIEFHPTLCWWLPFLFQN